MVDIGADALLINAQKVILQINGTTDTYIQLQELKPHFGRPEFREPTTDGGVQYFYGSGDHYFECTFLGTTDIISKFVTDNTRDVNGDMPVINYDIITTSKTGVTVTIDNLPTVLREWDYEDTPEGFLKIRAIFRITSDSVTTV